MSKSKQQEVEVQEEEEEGVSEEAPKEHLPTKPQTIRVVLEGVRPLLMSSPKELFEDKGGSKRRTEGYDDKVEAEKRAYRDSSGNLMVPARAIRACLIKASRLYSSGRKGISFTDMVKGSIFVDPEEIPLKNSSGKTMKKYIIDQALVVIKKSRIKRCRPRIDSWKLEFRIRWDPRLYGLKFDDLAKVIREAGHIGLLDYRPTYGIFEAKEIELME